MWGGRGFLDKTGVDKIFPDTGPPVSSPWDRGEQAWLGAASPASVGGSRRGLRGPVPDLQQPSCSQACAFITVLSSVC